MTLPPAQPCSMVEVEHTLIGRVAVLIGQLTQDVDVRDGRAQGCRSELVVWNLLNATDRETRCLSNLLLRVRRFAPRGCDRQIALPSRPLQLDAVQPHDLQGVDRRFRDGSATARKEVHTYTVTP